MQFLKVTDRAKVMKGINSIIPIGDLLNETVPLRDVHEGWYEVDVRHNERFPAHRPVGFVKKAEGMTVSY